MVLDLKMIKHKTKTMLKQIFTIGCMAMITMANASEEGFKLLTYEKFNAASTAFETSNDPNAVFYKGYALLRAGKENDAKDVMTKITTTPLGMVGLGWVELNKKNSTGAKVLFDAAIKASKSKDGLIFRFIGEAYTYTTGTKEPDAAIEKCKFANTLLKNNALNYIALGDAYLAKLDGGSAITQYEYADQYGGKGGMPNCKIGQVYYSSRNYPFSKDYLNRALAQDENNPITQRELGELYYKINKFEKAKEHFSKYMETGETTLDDKAMYANILFLGKDYPNAINTISEIIKVDNTRNYLNRLIGYSNYETEKYPEALEFMEKFLATQAPEKIIASDWEYYGKSLIKNKKDSIGLIYLVKSMDIDSSNRDKWGDVAAAFYAQKKYSEAAKYYTKKVDPDAPSASDWFNVGNSYYKAKDFANAITAFGKVIETKPDAGSGYLWRAKAFVQSDPDQKTSSAKPDFEKYISIGSADPVKNKKDLIEAYNYMAANALINANNKEEAKGFANKVLELDPANAQAQSVITAISTPQK